MLAGGSQSQQRARRQSQLSIHFSRRLLSGGVHSIFYHQISKRQEILLGPSSMPRRPGGRLFPLDLQSLPPGDFQLPFLFSRCEALISAFSSVNSSILPSLTEKTGHCLTPKRQGLYNTP